MKLLVTYGDENGNTKSALITGWDEEVESLPTILEGISDYNPGSTVAFVEIPDDFRPGVYDDQGDEIAMTFIDL